LDILKKYNRLEKIKKLFFLIISLKTIVRTLSNVNSIMYKKLPRYNYFNFW